MLNNVWYKDRDVIVVGIAYNDVCVHSLGVISGLLTTVYATINLK